VVYRFEWDENKAKKNLSSHGVSFPDAASILRDSNAMTLYDKEHSTDEDRWVTLGITSNGVLIVMVHTYNDVGESDSLIRIISARKATSREARLYERQ